MVKRASTALVLSLALLGRDAGAGIAFVQANSDAETNTVAPATVGLPARSDAGDLLVVAYQWQPPTVPAPRISDDHGNVFTPTAPPFVAADPNVGIGQMTYALNGSAAATPITVTVAGGPYAFVEVFVVEYSGVSSTQPLDQEGADTSDTTQTVKGPPLETTSPNEALVSMLISGGVATAGQGDAQRAEVNGDLTEDRFTGLPGTYAGTGFSSVASWSVVSASFRPGEVPIANLGCGCRDAGGGRWAWLSTAVLGLARRARRARVSG